MNDGEDQIREFPRSMEEDLILLRIPMPIIAVSIGQEFLAATVLRLVTRVPNSPFVKVPKKVIDSGYSPIVGKIGRPSFGRKGVIL
jgi:hypothetical protein